MRSGCRAGGLLLVLVTVAVVSAKGTTTRIVITGSELLGPIELRDRDVVAAFNVWSGPGTRMNGVEGMDGFIVDWRSGAVEPLITALRQFDISFLADRNSSGSDRLVYVVSYGLNPLSGEGYVYLPGVRTLAMARTCGRSSEARTTSVIGSAPQPRGRTLCEPT
jgi:hypothetical protein